MVDINQAFPSRFLHAVDLKDRAVEVTIRIVEEVVMRTSSGQGRKLVVYFDRARKGLILNKTCAQQIAAIAGTPETDQWPGVRVRLVPATTTFAGQSVACIRIEAAARPATAQS